MVTPYLTLRLNGAFMRLPLETRAAELLRRARQRELAVVVSILETMEELSLEYCGQDLYAEEVLWRSWNPAFSASLQSTAGNDAVNVGMELKLLPPSMEDCREAELCTEVLLLAGDLIERLRGSTEKEVKNERLVAERHRIQLFGDREDDVKVRNGQ